MVHVTILGSERRKDWNKCVMELVVRAKIDGWRVVLCVGVRDRLDDYSLLF